MSSSSTLPHMFLANFSQLYIVVHHHLGKDIRLYLSAGSGLQNRVLDSLVQLAPVNEADRPSDGHHVGAQPL